MVKTAVQAVMNKLLGPDDSKHELGRALVRLADASSRLWSIRSLVVANWLLNTSMALVTHEVECLLSFGMVAIPTEILHYLPNMGGSHKTPVIYPVVFDELINLLWRGRRHQACQTTCLKESNQVAKMVFMRLIMQALCCPATIVHSSGRPQ
eukprot:5071109-Amphidinium_carterae.1